MGGLQLVIADLNSTDHDVRNEAALVLSSAVQRFAVHNLQHCVYIQFYVQFYEY